MSKNSDINSNFQNLAPTLLGDIAPSEAFAPSIKQGATYLMTYSDKLKDPRWQKKRLEILNRDKFACKRCYDDSKTLHVHHLSYFKGKDPWDIESIYLVTLCEDCHKVETDDYQKSIDVLIDALKRKHFLSGNMESLTNLVINKLPSGFVAFDPNIDILGFAVSNREIWDQLDTLFFKSISKPKKDNTDNEPF